MQTKAFSYPAITLGHNTLAQLTLPEEEQRFPKVVQLLIMVASTMDEPGGYCPAENVRVEGRESIEALRDFLNEHFPPRDRDEVGMAVKHIDGLVAKFEMPARGFLKASALAAVNPLGKYYYDRGFAVETVSTDEIVQVTVKAKHEPE